MGADDRTVLIIGAGPTGLTAALALAAEGWPCRIVERRDGPSPLSRAVGVMPATLDLMDRLGAGAAFRSEAMRLTRVVFRQGDATLFAADADRAGMGARHLWGLPQDRTEDILRAALAEKGVAVEYGRALTGLSNDAAGVTAIFADGAREAFGWAIGADGVRSTARERIGVGYPGYDLDETWSIADVDIDGAAKDDVKDGGARFDPETVAIYLKETGGVAAIALPIEHARARVVAPSEDALAALPADLPTAGVRRAATFTISVRQAETYAKGRVLLAGDAAHCHSPVGGRGMNLGMGDAAEAAKAIMTGEILAYAAERHALGRRVIETTEAARRFVTASDPTRRVALRAALVALGWLPFAERAFWRRVAAF